MAKKNNCRKESERVLAEMSELSKETEDYTVRMLELLEKSDAAIIGEERQKIKTASRISKVMMVLLALMCVSIIACIVCKSSGVSLPEGLLQLLNMITWMLAIINTVASCEQALSRSRIAVIEAQRDYRHIFLENIKLKTDLVETQNKLRKNVFKDKNTF